MALCSVLALSQSCCLPGPVRRACRLGGGRRETAPLSFFAICAPRCRLPAVLVPDSISAWACFHREAAPVRVRSRVQRLAASKTGNARQLG